VIHVPSLEVRTLTAPFHPDQVHWMVAQTGIGDGGLIWARIVPYVTADTLRERLDVALGIDGWTSHLEEVTLGTQVGFKCRLRVRLHGRWIYREDVAPLTEEDALKGGASSAFKRACLALGVGSNLRRRTAVFAEIVTKGEHTGVHINKNGTEKTFRWRVPSDELRDMLEDYVTVKDQIAALQRHQKEQSVIDSALIPVGL
jgi:hypothetical protein